MNPGDLCISKSSALITYKSIMIKECGQACRSEEPFSEKFIEQGDPLLVIAVGPVEKWQPEYRYIYVMTHQVVGWLESEFVK